MVGHSLTTPPSSVTLEDGSSSTSYTHTYIVMAHKKISVLLKN